MKPEKVTKQVYEFWIGGWRQGVFPGNKVKIAFSSVEKTLLMASLLPFCRSVYSGGTYSLGNNSSHPPDGFSYVWYPLGVSRFDSVCLVVFLDIVSKSVIRDFCQKISFSNPDFHARLGSLVDQAKLIGV